MCLSVYLPKSFRKLKEQLKTGRGWAGQEPAVHIARRGPRRPLSFLGDSVRRITEQTALGNCKKAAAGLSPAVFSKLWTCTGCGFITRRAMWCVIRA